MTFCNLNAPSRFFKVPPKNTPKTHLKRGHTKKCQKQKLSSEYFGGSCSLESSTSCGSKSGILFYYGVMEEEEEKERRKTFRNCLMWHALYLKLGIFGEKKSCNIIQKVHFSRLWHEKWPHQYFVNRILVTVMWPLLMSWSKKITF